MGILDSLFGSSIAPSERQAALDYFRASTLRRAKYDAMIEECESRIAPFLEDENSVDEPTMKNATQDRLDIAQELKDGDTPVAEVPPPALDYYDAWHRYVDDNLHWASVSKPYFDLRASGLEPSESQFQRLLQATDRRDASLARAAKSSKKLAKTIRLTMDEIQQIHSEAGHYVELG